MLKPRLCLWCIDTWRPQGIIICDSTGLEDEKRLSTFPRPSRVNGEIVSLEGLGSSSIKYSKMGNGLMVDITASDFPLQNLAAELCLIL